MEIELTAEALDVRLRGMRKCFENGTDLFADLCAGI